MEKNDKRKYWIIACVAMIVVLIIVLLSSVINLVTVRQLAGRNAGSGEEGFISFGKSKKDKDTKKASNDKKDENDVSENELDINAIVENILLRDGVIDSNNTVDSNGIAVENVIRTNTNNGQNIDVGSLGRELDPGDLMMYTDILNKADYNPFIVQTYANVDQIDVFNVFYDGAGDTSSRERNVANEYREVFGDEPMNSANVVKVRVSYIEDLLRRRIGKVPDNWRESMKLSTFSEKYQAYYRENMDTQYQTIKVIKGFENNNTYTLIYQSVYTNNRTGTVTMVKQDNGEYRFLSNYYVYND